METGREGKQEEGRTKEGGDWKEAKRGGRKVEEKKTKGKKRKRRKDGGTGEKRRLRKYGYGGEQSYMLTSVMAQSARMALGRYWSSFPVMSLVRLGGKRGREEREGGEGGRRGREEREGGGDIDKEGM